MYQKILKNTLGVALDFLFPTRESVRKIETTSAEDLLKTLTASEPVALVHPTTSNNPRILIQTTALFAYSDEQVKHLVWEIKYYRNEKLIDAVGLLLAENILKKFSRKTKTLLVPIPVTARRLRERGYNHTELLAKAVLKHLPKNFELGVCMLKKIRHTPKQQSVENREDRFANIAGAFEATVSEFLKDSHIIILDDVVTTGATVNEAARTLLSAGAKSVEIIAIAH